MTEINKPKKHDAFFLWIAVAMSCTVAVGFWFTYFGLLLQGAYPQGLLTIHLHGWSFFAWYILLIVQAGLIRSRKVMIHRTLGLASIVLGVVMIIFGLITSTVRIHLSLGPDGDPFWKLNGLPIFFVWVLFTGFYVAAIYYRWRKDVHKRLILLASAAALSAATFRIAIQFLGFEQWVVILGFAAPILFILAGMIYDFRSLGKIHPVYLWGLPMSVVLGGGAFLVTMILGGSVLEQGVAWVGRMLMPFYY